jgi:hypothetical protein
MAVTLNVVGTELAVRIPFSWNGSERLIPTGPSPVSGAFEWFNYTFPAQGGVWQYQALPGIAGGSSGLVFSYSACPQ